MSEIKTPPIKIRVGDDEYDCFGDNHTWNDIARWIKAHGPTDEDEFRRYFDEVAA